MHIVIGGRDVVTLLKKTASEVLDDNILGLSAETAYNFFFGLFPTFLFAAPLLSLFEDKQRLYAQVLSALASLPTDAYTLVRGVLKDVIFAKSAPGLMSLGAILALYGGAGMFSSVMSALNTAYDVVDTRAWWKQKLIAIAATIVAVITLGSSVSLILGGQKWVNFAMHLFHLGPFGEVVSTIFQYVAAFALLVASLFALYMLLPNVQGQQKKHTIVGALIAATLWVLFTLLFRLYVTNYGSYNRTYGAVGAVIVLLTWMYWSMFAILAGGELNSELHAGTGRAEKGRGGSTVLASGRISTHEGPPHPSAEVR